MIDKSSPLYGATLESLEASRSLFAVSVSGIDPIIAAPVQAQHDYSWRDVRFGERFIDIYTQSAADSSRWITVAFTKPKLRSKFRPALQTLPIFADAEIRTTVSAHTNERSNTICLVMSV